MQQVIQQHFLNLPDRDVVGGKMAVATAKNGQRAVFIVK